MSSSSGQAGRDLVVEAEGMHRAQLEAWQHSLKIEVRSELAEKLYKLTGRETVGPLFENFEEDYCFRYISKERKIGMIMSLGAPTEDDILYQNYKVLWEGEVYQKNYLYEAGGETPLNNLLPFMTPFFHDWYFHNNFLNESQLEIMAIHDNFWNPPSIEWYNSHLKHWFEKNSYTLLEFFPYEQLRNFMLKKSGRKEAVKQKQIKTIKENLERKMNEIGKNMNVKLDQQVIKQVMTDIRELSSDTSENCNTYNTKYDVQKMGPERLEKFLLQLLPVCAPNEFYVENLENLLPMSYVRMCPSAEKFEQILKGWRGENYEVVLTQ